jgi:hypothetical protein
MSPGKIRLSEKQLAAYVRKGATSRSAPTDEPEKEKPRLEGAARCECGAREGAFFKRDGGWKCLACVVASETPR